MDVRFSGVGRRGRGGQSGSGAPTDVAPPTNQAPTQGTVQNGPDTDMLTQRGGERGDVKVAEGPKRTAAPEAGAQGAANSLQDAAASQTPEKRKFFAGLGEKIKDTAKWVVSSGEYKKKAGPQSVRYGSMVVGAGVGGAGGYGAAHVIVEKTPLKEKMSQEARALTKKIAAGAGAVVGAIGLPKLLPVIFKGLKA